MGADMTTNETTLRHTPLDEVHRKLGAKMVPFVGWSLPLQFKGIIEEHKAVRAKAGVFDVSHMGRLFLSGPDAAALLRRALSYNVDRLALHRGHYTLLCTENGGIIDDAIIYRLDDERFVLVDNSVNANRDREHIASLVEDSMRVTIDDRQPTTAMIALQGPEARRLAAEVLGSALIDSLPRHACAEFPLLGSKAFIGQSGYTGEDGFELIAAPDQGRALWEGLVASGVQPCGLGARDTLRLEAALALYGHEIDETTNPFEAGLGWVVDLDERDFVGKKALIQAKAQQPQRRLVCVMATDKGVMRDGNDVISGEQVLGRITSGSFSPTLQCSIGMAYVPPAFGAEGTMLEVDVRGRRLPVVVVKRPFYKSTA